MVTNMRQELSERSDQLEKAKNDIKVKDRQLKEHEEGRGMKEKEMMEDRQRKIEEIELGLKKSREECKKKQKEVEKVKKEMANQYGMMEEERAEKSRGDRKIVQLEENYKELTMINKQLEVKIDQKQMMDGTHTKGSERKQLRNEEGGGDKEG